MMLTPEFLVVLRHEIASGEVSMSISRLRQITYHMEAQHARIEKLEQLLKRWNTFGEVMQKAGSELPRHLITDTEIVMKEWE